jgi:hypothetical protein
VVRSPRNTQKSSFSNLIAKDVVAPSWRSEQPPGRPWEDLNRWIYF